MLETLRAGDRNFFFDVVRILPGVDGVRFLDINNVEGDPVLVLLVQLVERGNLPPERGSGITSEDEYDRFLTAKGRKLDAGLLVCRMKREVRR